MLFFEFFFYCLFFCAIHCYSSVNSVNNDAAPIVWTKYGPIQGTTVLNNTVNIFYGIPYAQAPIGNLRFEKPLPPKPWAQPRQANASNIPPWCIQHTPDLCTSRNCNEDCLYMNIFAPNRNSTHYRRAELFPVIVFIHGGAFAGGSAVAYNNFTDIGRRYVQRGIVTVAIQYRLSVLGFAAIGERQMPGNYGLWDQTAALKFVAENIAFFGGDPRRVTVQGYSAGAASASLLGMSPHSKNLFQKVFQMSGSSLAAWSCNDRVVDATVELVNVLNCSNNSSMSGIKECMKNKTLDEINAAITIVGPTRSYRDVNFSKWGPHVDGDFLPADLPVLIAKSKPKPTVIGFADLESLYFTLLTRNTTVCTYAIPYDEMSSYDHTHFDTFIRDVVARADMISNGKVANAIQERIAQFYLSQKRDNGTHRVLSSTSDFYIQRMSMILSDLAFIVPIIMETQQKLQASWPIYFYKSSYYNDAAFPANVTLKENFHTNDLNYYFYRGLFPFNANDWLINDFFTNSLINFVKNSNPSNGVSGGWERAEVADIGNNIQPFMHSELPKPTMKSGGIGDPIVRAKFWAKLANEYPDFNLVRGTFK